MRVGIIKNRKELENLECFEVGNLLWGTKEIPRTYGYLGFVLDDGFYLKMICEERNPLCVYKDYGDPVYKDSAMEAFFKFQSKKVEGYFNFEMNANGALLTEFGTGRSGRKKLDQEVGKLLECQADIKKDYWSVSLHIPLAVLERYYGEISIDENYQFTCNFYKISETKEMEHYASCFVIESKIPNFHMPECFGTAIVKK